MKVSVVIPAYKAAATIQRAVDSVLAQTRPPHEVIVVDDGSPDDQVDVIERAYGDRADVILIRQPNGKTAEARNRGIRESTGDLIAFLDADDYWEPEKLARQVPLFQQYPEVGLVAATWYSENPGNPRKRPKLDSRKRAIFDRVLTLTGRDTFRVGTLIWTGTVVVRRSALPDPVFISGLEPAEDRDLWIRVASHHSAYLLSEPLATVVLESGSISRSSIENDCRSMLLVVNRHRDLLGICGTRAWRSYVHYRWSAIEPDCKNSLPHLAYSLMLWPLPLQPFLRTSSLGRIRRLLYLCRQLLRRNTRSACDA